MTYPKAVGKAVSILFCAILALFAHGAIAINASPHPVQVTQPDGTRISLRIHGNAGFNWKEDSNGYTVLRDKNRRYFYARRAANGHLVVTPHEVGKANPRALGLEKRVLPSAAVIAQLRANGPGGTVNDGQQSIQQTAPLGTVKNLVIAIKFSNHGARPVPSEADLDVLFNEVDSTSALAPTGSVRDVYYVNSYGQLTLASTIADWVTVSNTETYYANGSSGDQTLHQALIEALEAVDETVNFNEYDVDNDGYIDSITFLHSGYGAEWGGDDAYGTYYYSRIWSHRWVLWDTDGNGSSFPPEPEWSSNEGVKVWDYHISPALWGTSGSEIGRIGVIAHETGHFFGLPDFYDTNGGGEGIGSYGMMANSWGFDSSQLYPPHFSPWSKAELGWSTPTVLAAPGNYVLQASENANEYYRIDQGYPPGEYLLIENRQPAEFDAAMPQGGLAIWHIDESADDVTEGYPGQSGWPGNGRHYRVSLLQADGNYDLELGNNRGDGGDVFRAGAVDGISKDGTSGSPSNSFPDTDSYQSGYIIATNNAIDNISASATSMSFDYSNSVPQAGPDLAQADQSNAYGQLSGSYIDTHSLDNNYQVLTESHSGGKPANRHDRLQHTWSFTLNGGNHQFNLNAFMQGTGDADTGFDFSWSTSSSGGYVPMFTVTDQASSNSYLTHDLGISSGTVYVRAEDNNRSSGENSNNSLHINHMFIDGGAPLTTPPGQASNPFPSNGATGIGQSTTLSWTAGTDTESHYVYFGDTMPPAYQGQQAGTSFATPLLMENTTYYWRIDEDNDFGTTTGDVWSFTTGADIQPGQATGPNPSNGAIGVVLNPILSWTAGANAVSHDVYFGTAGNPPTNQGNQSGTSFNAGQLLTDQEYVWRIDEVNGFGSTTTGVLWNFYSASAPDFDLTANGYKVRGKHTVDLAWNSAAAPNEGGVDIYRNQTKIASNETNNGEYTDNTGNKGSASYSYQVCVAGSTVDCSDFYAVVF